MRGCKSAGRRIRKYGQVLTDDTRLVGVKVTKGHRTVELEAGGNVALGWTQIRGSGTVAGALARDGDDGEEWRLVSEGATCLGPCRRLGLPSRYICVFIKPDGTTT